ncbi:DNA gyrase inhibitor YacG [Hydrogenophaga sp. OTU3427]|uniref:DNA gyrase inhibitor YacG n=1 Tax=Hydrogenophaga sp. OTU3427 TaxID=3043856 RepID=UPI00406CEDB7
MRCPACGGPSIYATSNRYRPFCSERCKQTDLGAWASESFRMPTEAPPDEQPFGDPRLQ